MRTLLLIFAFSLLLTGCKKGMDTGSGSVTPIIPTLSSTTSITSITSSTAASGGSISSDGGATVIARGVCWGTSAHPDITGDHTSDGTGAGTFSSAITGLIANTVYYVRSYATNSIGTAYGTEVSFTTTNNPTALATVTTDAATMITTNSASVGGNVSNDGGATVTLRGLCWSTTSNPDIAGSHTTDGTGTGIFSTAITSLAANTTYHVRAYATNSVGTAYGNEISFTTSPNAVLPTITTKVASLIKGTSASSGGNISNDGGAPITARGVCWSTTPNPGITGVTSNHTTDGTGAGTFTSNITGLVASNTYFIRAYATNSAGTAYGNQLSFTTSIFPNVVGDSWTYLVNDTSYVFSGPPTYSQYTMTVTIVDTTILPGGIHATIWVSHSSVANDTNYVYQNGDSISFTSDKLHPTNYSRRYVLPFNVNSSWFYSWNSFPYVTVIARSDIYVNGNLFENAAHINGRFGMPDDIHGLDEWVADNIGVVKRYVENTGTLNPYKDRTGWTLISYHLE